MKNEMSKLLIIINIKNDMIDLLKKDKEKYENKYIIIDCDYIKLKDNYCLLL